MLELRYDGNVFLLPRSDSEAAVVTTNGIVRRNGSLVMGAGIARYCRDSMLGIDAVLGGLVASDGNHAFFAGTYDDPNRAKNGLAASVNVLSMPTKQDWRDDSDIGLITRSCHELSNIAARHGLERIYLPAPGCTNGRLDYVHDVRNIVSGILGDGFVVCLPSRTYDATPRNGSDCVVAGYDKDADAYEDLAIAPDIHGASGLAASILRRHLEEPIRGTSSSEPFDWFVVTRCDRVVRIFTDEFPGGHDPL